MPKYDKLTQDFAKWLIDSNCPLIDRYDWGEWSKRQKRPIYSATNGAFEVWYKKLAKYPPQQLTRTTLQSHLSGGTKLYYTSSRRSGFALVCIDVDAHRGQTDAFDTAMFVRDRYFPLAYLEPSRRGFHIYVLVRVGRCRRKKFNLLLNHLQENLREVLLENNCDSTLEVLGGFTIVEDNRIVHRAALAPLPELPNRAADLKWLTEMPIYLISALLIVREDADLAREMIDDHNCTDLPAQTGRRLPVRNSPCAWDRMQWACYDFTTQHRRLPDLEELLAYYQRLYETDTGDQRRHRRAQFAIKYRSQTFDITKATEGGYELYRRRLCADVAEHCTDRTSKYIDGEITDEDLAIGLYVVMRNSFSVSDDPRRQYSCPSTAFSKMFTKLKEEGVTNRGGADRNKIVAIKTILSRARLIECVDSGYIHGDHWGVAKKFTLGPTCWRHVEFVRFSQNISVTYITDLRNATEVSAFPATDAK